MFWTFKLSFDEDIMTFLVWQLFGKFFLNLGIFFQSSGHPVLVYEQTFRIRHCKVFHSSKQYLNLTSNYYNNCRHLYPTSTLAHCSKNNTLTNLSFIKLGLGNNVLLYLTATQHVSVQVSLVTAGNSHCWGRLSAVNQFRSAPLILRILLYCKRC